MSRFPHRLAAGTLALVRRRWAHADRSRRAPTVGPQRALHPRHDALMNPTPADDDEPTAAAEGADAPIALRPMTPAQRRAFQVLSSTTAPVWLAMILFPRAKATAQLVRVATPLYAALGIAYTALLARAMATGDGEIPRFDDPDALRAGLMNPDAFLAGWTHYLVFDLYVGRHIWATALDRGRSDRIPLLLTWMTGPLGLTLHLARNAIDAVGGRRG